MAKKKTKLDKMSKDEKTSLAYALATNLAKHGKPQSPKNERQLTKGEEKKKEKHMGTFKKAFDLEEIKRIKEELKNPKKADLNKDGKLSSYEKTRGAAIEKAMKKEDLDIGHQDNEPHMLKKDLYRIAKYAAELYKMIDQFDVEGQEVDFPQWWQAKIITSKEAMVKAKHYLDGELTVPQIDAMLKEEMGINDPILIKLRADKMRREKEANMPKPIAPKMKKNNSAKIALLQKERAQLMRDMEQEAEPEGGPIADEYGDKLNRIDKAIAKLSGQGEWGPERDTDITAQEIAKRAAMMGEEKEYKVLSTKELNKLAALPPTDRSFRKDPRYRGKVEIGDELIMVDRNSPAYGRKGKVVRLTQDGVEVDFGRGDKYGIISRRIKGNKITA